MTVAIEVSGASKRFRKGFRYHSLREEISRVGARLLGKAASADDPEIFWALRDLSFDVDKGSCLGIIGSNGAGKSTLLKLVARVSYPTEGRVRVRGRVAALLDAGAGLHPEVSGRDNVFINGAILGMSRSEIAEKYSSIVEFAELEPFMTMPVKRYSSGMFVRLGFSVAVHTDPHVLLVDEVLSVGDIAFQAKSMERMLSFRKQGVTILFVSHNLPAVAQMCDRVLWIENGQKAMLGAASDVLEAYQQHHDRRMREARSAEEIRGRDTGTGEIIIESITTHHADGRQADSFAHREALLLRIHYRAFVEIRRPYFIVRVTHHTGAIFTATMELDEQCPERLEGRGTMELLFHELPLLPGVYNVVGEIIRDAASSYFRSRVLASFVIASPLAEYGFRGLIGMGNVRNLPPVVVPYEWRGP
jgi:ABC-type polysaccharide/polyol phosphate transport system ATPase subunit